MASIIDALMQQLSGDNLSTVSNQIGSSPSATQSALAAAVPLLVTALAHNASRPQGAQDLHQALANDHDGQLLDHTGQYVNSPDYQQGSGILGHVLGDQRPAVEQALAQKTGMDANQVGKILEMAAPLVMAYLGKQQRQQGLDPNGLAGLLANQQQAAQATSPDAVSLISNLLGGSGSGADNLGQALGGLLGGR